jgi:hypothetical protein
MPRSSDVRRRIFAIGDLIANLELWSANKVEQVIDKQPTPQNRRRTGRSSPIPNGEAHRFKPGQSGNPGGRPKTGALTRAFRDILERRVPDKSGRTYAEAIAERLVDIALKGYMPAVRELGDRAEGRAGQTLEIEARLQRLEPQSPYFERVGQPSEAGSSSDPKLAEECRHTVKDAAPGDAESEMDPRV